MRVGVFAQGQIDFDKILAWLEAGHAIVPFVVSENMSEACTIARRGTAFPLARGVLLQNVDIQAAGGRTVIVRYGAAHRSSALERNILVDGGIAAHVDLQQGFRHLLPESRIFRFEILRVKLRERRGVPGGVHNNVIRAGRNVGDCKASVEPGLYEVGGRGPPDDVRVTLDVIVAGWGGGCYRDQRYLNESGRALRVRAHDVPGYGARLRRMSFGLLGRRGSKWTTHQQHRKQGRAHTFLQRVQIRINLKSKPQIQLILQQQFR